MGIAKRITALGEEMPFAKRSVLGEVFRYTITTLHKLDFYTDCMVCSFAIHKGYRYAMVMTVVLIGSFAFQVVMAACSESGSSEVLRSLMAFVPEVMSKEGAVVFE